MRRAITLTGLDKTLELSMSTYVKVPAGMLHFDELDDGTWRLTRTPSVLEDFTPVRALVFENVTKGKLADAAVRLDGTEVVLQLAKAIPMGPSKDPSASPTSKRIHFDRMADGKWTLLYSPELIPDISKLSEMTMIRED